MPRLRPAPRHRFVFVSSNGTSWGGSEELWAATAVSLAEAGHEVSVYKANIDETQPPVRRLRALGCRVRDFSDVPLVPRKAYAVVARVSNAVIAVHRLIQTALALAFSEADLVVISQGGNFDGLPMANVCRRMKKPYVLISQKAGDMYWPIDARLDRMRAVFTQALACYFVSEHNRRLTEEQLGMELTNASVVRNPFLVSWEKRNDWPDDGDGLRLACIGRLYPAEKGQDLLIRVLAREHWRKRPLSVSIYGTGHHRDGLERMAAYYGLTSVKFGGFASDVKEVWKDHHGLILPSRCEGLPLVLVEAMLSGRVPIVTDVAGNREIVTDGVTGFLASAANEDALDEALERAWQRRDEWRTIGSHAADAIRTLVPRDPGAALAVQLLGILGGSTCESEVPALVTP